MILPWCAITSELHSDGEGAVTLTCVHGVWVGSTAGQVLEAWVEEAHPKFCDVLLNDQGVIPEYITEATKACAQWRDHPGAHTLKQPEHPRTDLNALAQRRADEKAQKLLELLLKDWEEANGPLTEAEIAEAKRAWEDAGNE